MGVMVCLSVILAYGRWGQEDQELEANISYKRLFPIPILPPKKGRIRKAKAEKAEGCRAHVKKCCLGGGRRVGNMAGFKDKGWVVVTWSCVFSEDCCHYQG